MLAQGQQKLSKQQVHVNLLQIDLHSNAKPLKRQKIPKIGNKQIPLHNFGNTFTHLPLSKQKTYRSKLWHSPIRKCERPESENKPSNYNRPEYLLKQYLDRKQKIFVQPLLTNPQSFTQSQSPSKIIGKTTNDFRVRKHEKKIIYEPLFVESKPKTSQNKSEQLYNTNHDFIGFTASKNIYDMTYEQLQQSIKWKKKFLDALNSQVRSARTTSFRQRLKI